MRVNLLSTCSGFSPDFPLHLKKGSLASIKALSSMEPMTFLSKEQLVSRHGFLLTQISHTLKSSSIMKSRPNTQQQNSFSWSCSLSHVESKASRQRPTICGQMDSKNSTLQFWRKYSANASNDSLLLVSYLPYSGQLFCTASFVKWMYRLLSSMSNSLLTVRTYPRSYQYTWNCPLVAVASAQHRMSNLRPLYSSGIIYFWIMAVALPPTMASTFFLILCRSRSTMMPCPLLVFQPGLRIHQLPFSYCIKNDFHSSHQPASIWKVKGMWLKGFFFTDQQQLLRFKNRFFLQQICS